MEPTFLPLVNHIPSHFGQVGLFPIYAHYPLAAFIYPFLLHFYSIPNELLTITKKNPKQKQ